MDLGTYKNYLQRHGRNLAEVKKNQSDIIIDHTFKRDPNYKRVYILTRDGWKWEDAKYQIHTAPSIVKDAVDYWLQFRPKVHYPIGSYVIIPDDTAFDVNLTPEQIENPWLQPAEERTQWWFIVGRDDARSYVRYYVLKCNHEFRWIWRGKIMRCFGANRSANSYTSGRWLDEISASLDNLTNAWLPDVCYTYGVENLSNLGLDNNQTISYDQRFMLSNSVFYPSCYQVTKVTDMTPQGVIKLSLKQDDFNEKRDNVQLRICDYYTEEGNIKVDIPSSVTGISTIAWKTVNSDGELIDGSASLLERGKVAYFEVVSEDRFDPEWHLSLLTAGEDEEYYVNLMQVTEFDDKVVAVKPRKAGSLVGKQFRLSVSDRNGNYYSYVDLEVK